MMRRVTGRRRLAAHTTPVAPSAVPGRARTLANGSVRRLAPSSALRLATFLAASLSASLAMPVAWGRPIGIASAAQAGIVSAAPSATAPPSAIATLSATNAPLPARAPSANGGARLTADLAPRSTVKSTLKSATRSTTTGTPESTTAAAPRKPSPPHPPINTLTPAMAQCFDWASHRFGMSSHLLYAIALQESGLNPRAVNRNANGSQDIGLMQINSSWAPTLARYGIRPSDLWDPCTNILVGAWILGDNLVRMGPTVAALGAYNARDPVKREAYARRVLERLHRLTTPPPHRVSPPPAAGLPPAGPHLVSR